MQFKLPVDRDPFEHFIYYIMYHPPPQYLYTLIVRSTAIFSKGKLVHKVILLSHNYFSFDCCGLIKKDGRHLLNCWNKPSSN